MRNAVIKKYKLRQKRSYRVRNRIHSTALQPRLCVVKSNKHIHAQLIDDTSGRTLGSVATFSKEYKGTDFAKKSKASGRKLGERIAEIALGQGIKQVIFDRGPFKYHGILAELADAARAAGLQF